MLPPLVPSLHHNKNCSPSKSGAVFVERVTVPSFSRLTATGLVLGRTDTLSPGTKLVPSEFVPAPPDNSVAPLIDAAGAALLVTPLPVTVAAVLVVGLLLVRHGHPAVADAFAATRLAGDRGRAYGTLPSGAPTADIIARALPS